MSDTLRDQLLQLGFKPPPKARDERTAPAGKSRQRGGGPRHGAPQGKGAQHEHGGGAKGAQHGRDRGPREGQRDGKPAGARRGRGGAANDAAGKSGAEMDLARAYALRQREEQAQRQREERERQQQAQQRREARQKLAQLLEGKARNAAEAELPRHFEFGGKIRRVYVTAEQLKAINAGALGVVQLGGRYLLVDAAIARDAAAILPDSLALLVDPSQSEGGDAYADPRFQVPDDLVW